MNTEKLYLFHSSSALSEGRVSAHWSQVRVFLMAPASAHYPSVDTGPVTACPALVTPSSPHKALRISPSPPSSVFISRAPVSGHDEWRGHVFCCCTSTAVTFPFYCSFVTYGLILKVVFQEILDINSHSILTDSFLPSCR